jgi:phosphopantothenoylcysteine decarboxylase / phosphopantothenate---cysteine ligase
MTLKEKKILIGISGGIAAYKIPELVRRLKERGAEIRIIMTHNATHFVTPLTLQTVSGQSVSVELNEETEHQINHIQLARWADLILIAPATANVLAKLTHGLADDLLSTVCLASAAPLAVAPAMNQQMWYAPATQYNINLLKNRGILFYGPADGDQACGENGTGRLLDIMQLIELIENFFNRNELLKGKTVIVTAGATREDFDPVRFISNRSSGKMGYAVARAAHCAGAQVILISGITSLVPPQHVDFIKIYSAQDLLEAVMQYLIKTDIYIGTAAVADYRPITVECKKIKKNQSIINIEFERTPDVLATVAKASPRPFTVGFAAETQDIEKYAFSKLNKKNLDMIAANQVGLSNQGFDSDFNALHVLWRDGSQELPRAPKSTLAHQLIGVIAHQFKRFSTGMEV